MTIEIGIGLSTTKTYTDVAQEAVEQAKAQLGTGKIDLALLFTSVGFAHTTVLKTIHNLLGPVPIIGASSMSVIFNQAIFKHGLLLLLCRMPKDVTTSTGCVREISKISGLKAGRELAEKLLSCGKDQGRSLNLVFSDGLIPDSPQLLSGWQERKEKNLPLIGAGAADNFEFNRTYIYCDEGRFADAACGVCWSGNFSFGMGIKHGWQPIGKLRRVTQSQGNVVEAINGLPAVRVYEEYFGKDASQLKTDLKRISVSYPLGIYIAEENEYLLRNILSIEDNGSLVFKADVPAQSSVRLMIGSKQTCLAAARLAAQEVKKQMGQQKMDFAFVFDSISRYTFLGKQATEELKTIKEVLGRDTPLVGIYTYSEQARYFYNQTIAVLGMAG